MPEHSGGYLALSILTDTELACPLAQSIGIFTVPSKPGPIGPTSKAKKDRVFVFTTFF